MIFSKHSGKHFLIFAFLLMPSPDTAGACLDQGTGSAVLKVLAAVLVGGVFFYNHFRNRINTLLSNLFSKGKGKERIED